MILDTNLCLALKNPYEQYDIYNFTLFDINSMNLKLKSLNVSVYKNRQVRIKVKCPLCLETHYYRYNIYDFINRDMIIGGCKEFGLPVFMIGKSENINEKVKKINEIRENLYAML